MRCAVSWGRQSFVGSLTIEQDEEGEVRIAMDVKGVHPAGNSQHAIWQWRPHHRPMRLQVPDTQLQQAPDRKAQVTQPLWLGPPEQGGGSMARRC